VLDGGHLVFLGIEGIRRRPVSATVRRYATQVGFALLIALMIAVTLNDLKRLF
ncbi:MAG: site-2 protease family protein, partial [Deltaproteobacteria bacterium]|nr:site-2 protease family protein [Deltaproteobacteria bacterium]